MVKAKMPKDKRMEQIVSIKERKAKRTRKVQEIRRAKEKVRNSGKQ